MKYKFLLFMLCVAGITSSYAAELNEPNLKELSQLRLDKDFNSLLKKRFVQFTNPFGMRMYKLDLSNLGLTSIIYINDLEVPYVDTNGKYHEQYPLTRIPNLILLLNDNYLKFIPSGINAFNKNLATLNVDNNELETLPNEILNLERINFISVKNNPLQSLPWKSAEELKAKLKSIVSFNYLPLKIKI